MNTELCNGIHWVGAVDWNLRDFHGYETPRGGTYNAYLVQDHQTALIDAVKGRFAPQLLRNIADLTDRSRVDWVVCNHAEPDHAGGLPEVMAALPNASLVCTEKCRQTLSLYYDMTGWKIKILNPGETLSLGKRTLEFLQTPLAHWPESMFTYVPEEQLLFSMDAFGQHLATSQRFDDECDRSLVLDEARTYYANILMPLGGPTGKALGSAAKRNIRMIAPSHGVIWRTHIPEIISSYQRWTAGRVEPRVLIFYDTMWESTAQMAESIYEGVVNDGVEARLHHIRLTGLTRIAAEALEAAAIAVGSPTLNSGPMPMVAAAMTYLQGLKPVNKTALAFGSAGWAKGGADAVQSYFEALKWNVLRDPIRAQYRPTQEILEECRQAGSLLAEKAAAAAK